jgi:hypothetical protein
VILHHAKIACPASTTGGTSRLVRRSTTRIGPRSLIGTGSFKIYIHTQTVQYLCESLHWAIKRFGANVPIAAAAADVVTISRVAETKGLPPLPPFVSWGGDPDVEVGVDCPLLLLPDGVAAVGVVIVMAAVDLDEQGGSSSPSPIPTPNTKDEMAW